jgi:hypothetical protein
MRSPFSLLKRLTSWLTRPKGLVVFPIAIGLFLTSLGAFELYSATVVPIPKWVAPYGFLVFTSAEAELEELYLSLHGGIRADDNRGGIFLTITFSANISSLNEEVVGVQIPYDFEHDIYMEIWRFDSEGRTVPLELTARNVMAVGNNTSLAYLKFVASPESTRYTVAFKSVWKGFIITEGFSSYSIVFPIGNAGDSVHSAVLENFPNVHTYYGRYLGKIRVELSLPQEIEIKRIHPLPKTEVVQAGKEGRFFYWEFTTTAVGVGAPSEIITASFEDRKKTEVRNRLLFDSGLYMGLGIGLIISGLHETLKYLMEKRKNEVHMSTSES